MRNKWRVTKLDSVEFCVVEVARFLPQDLGFGSNLWARGRRGAVRVGGYSRWSKSGFEG